VPPARDCSGRCAPGPLPRTARTSSGYPLVHTPNVDRLAAEGARFTNACTTGAVCSASRSAFMTGMYQTTIGAHHHRSHRRDGYTLPDPVHVFTKYFRDAGYFTALCGQRKTDWNFKPKVKPYDSHKWEDLKTHQPFFAQYQFGETHRRRTTRTTRWPARTGPCTWRR